MKKHNEYCISPKQAYASEEEFDKDFTTLDFNKVYVKKALAHTQRYIQDNLILDLEALKDVFKESMIQDTKGAKPNYVVLSGLPYNPIIVSNAILVVYDLFPDAEVWANKTLSKGYHGYLLYRIG